MPKSDVPHKSQLARAFKEFAKDDIASKALAECLNENLGRNGIMHASHDSSEIEAREKGVTRKRDAKEAQSTAETRIERLQGQDEATNFAELPMECDWGCKRNSKGKVERWKGCKLHLAVGDGDIPLNGTAPSNWQSYLPLPISLIRRHNNMYYLSIRSS